MIAIGDFIELVVRLDAVEKKYPGGIEGLKRDYKVSTDKIMWGYPVMDDHIAYIAGAMNSVDMKNHVDAFERRLGDKISKSDRKGNVIEFTNGCICEMGFPSQKCKWLRTKEGNPGVVEFVEDV